ncbi:MAG: N-acetyl-gamma-glutamyl-phosphate reductase [Mariprofundaceae bacterium]
MNVAILGATGYTGSELIRLLDAHPQFQITHLAAHSQAGKRAGDVLPGLVGSSGDMILSTADAPLADDVVLCFTALPHAASALAVQRLLDAGKKVVDLSADFRHQDPETYRAAYGIEHPCSGLFEQAVYGLSEFARDAVASAQLVANPGCYPTSALLPLVPLLKADLIDVDRIIIDSKSGASGAGRAASKGLLYCEINEGVAAYGLPRHRHAWEIEEWATSFASKGEISVRFVPHILPMTRGMLTTLHLTGRDVEVWHRLLSETFMNEPFVRVLPEGVLPSTQAVKGSNRCDIGVVALSSSEAVVVSCIDNLLKGASGQAVQNANIMMGMDEGMGLSSAAFWP